MAGFNSGRGDSIMTKTPVGGMASLGIWTRAANRASCSFIEIQSVLRRCTALSELDLEDAKSAIGRANLTGQELAILEQIARGIAANNERYKAWHGGMWDLVVYLSELRTSQAAA